METVKQTLLTWGLPGLFFIALLDSAGIPLPGGPDAVVILLSWQRPALAPIVALTAACGSTVGCWILYRIARRGGELALSRLDSKTVERAKQRLGRNDMVAVSVGVLGPPPFPTKIFILTAGVMRMATHRFLLAVFTGRVVRYLGEAYLGARFGDRAANILKSHYGTIGFGLVAAVATVLIVQYLWTKKSGKPVHVETDT